MYKKVSTDLNFEKREHDVIQYWKDNKVFEKSIELKKDAPTFTFFDGPPTANGMPHIGHIITRVYKDLIPRYKTMKGYKVFRKAGWDTHGLPVELEVEKKLGISGKPQIEDYGVEPFIKQCKESVWKYEKEWEKMTDRIGFWLDMEHPYVTYHNDYIESVWWAIKKIWDKGLLYKGHKVVPYCPRCGTPLSSHEVAQGYKDVKEPSVYVKFEVKGQKQVYLMAWTTTPWTLPSNVALTINPDEIYIKAKVKDEVYILAEALAQSVLEEEFEILEKCKGQDLIGIEYVPLFDFTKVDKKAFYVVAGDFVTLTDGTGIVHTAPAFGEDDAKIGMKYDLPFVQLVNDQGSFVDSVTPWKGMFVKDADPKIIENLDERNLLYKAVDYEHSYPFCWRCDTHLIYYARDSWFIKMTEVRDQLVKNNKTVNWIPETIGEGRFGNFLENVVDWSLSRERYWGTPLPVWECECGHRHVIGSISELKEMGKNVPDGIELHKPYIDDVYLNCPECKGTMKRVSEVIDCWFDSGAMPFAQWHYPFENKEIFEDNFPADFISEAIDQTRGWFYTLLAISTLLFDKAPYKNVIVLGHGLDKEGKKMSKSKGNAISPDDALGVLGADAIRWYFFVSNSPWLPNRFYYEAVTEYQRKFMGTLWNTYAFYVLYANIDSFDPTKYVMDKSSLSVMDKWALSKLNTLIKTVDENLANYRVTEPARAIQDFVDQLSNWYVRRSRERFWEKGMEQDKINAYMTLYNCLITVCKLAAPFIPFMTEEIYLNMVRGVDKSAPESIHLCDFSIIDEAFIDSELEKNMELVLRVVVQGRACRNTANIKNRQPLGKIYVKASSELPEIYKDVVKEELNVKEVIFTDDVTNFTSYKFKPQLRTLGPKYGKLVAKISEVLNTLNDKEVLSKFRNGENISFEIEEMLVELTESDILIETTQKDGMISESDKEITVVIDTNLTLELIEEGFVREIVSKVQTMRKEADFEVVDHIKFYYKDNQRIAEIISRNIDIVSNEILGDEVSVGEGQGYSKEWDINGEKVIFTVVKV